MRLLRFTNWDKYKDDRSICKLAGCNENDIYICCPDLDGSICKPKKKLLVQLDVKEQDLDSNLVTLQDIRRYREEKKHEN